MARRRRLTPAQPGYLGPAPDRAASAAAGAPPIAQVSGAAAEAAALKALTDGLQAARADGRMVVEVPLGDVAPGHLARDRLALEAEALAALKASIHAHGQRVPAEITPLEAGAETASPYRFGLISGWRRLRALAELHDETGEARFSVLRALIRPPGQAADSYVAMVEENEIREGLSYYERARIVAEATARGVFADRAAALRALFATASRAKRSKIGSFLELHDALGEVLRFPAEIPERLGLALVARLRAEGPERLRAALVEAAPTSGTAEMALLTRLTRAPGGDVSRAKHAAEVLRPGLAFRAARRGDRITLELSGADVDDALLARLQALVRAQA